MTPKPCTAAFEASRAYIKQALPGKVTLYRIATSLKLRAPAGQRDEERSRRLSGECHAGLLGSAMNRLQQKVGFGVWSALLPSVT